MDSQAVVIVLRLLHILGGIFWVGAILVLGQFVFPTQRELGADGTRFLQLLMGKHKLQKWLAISAPVTVLSGALLMWRDARLGGFMASRPGQGFSLGAAAALLAAIIGMAVNAPIGKKIAALGQKMAAAPDPAIAAEIQRLVARATTSLRFVTILLVIAAIAMATARYW